MKIIRLLLLSFIISSHLSAQDSSRVKKVINEILTMKLPTKFKSYEPSSIKAYAGTLNKIFYGFQFYDRIVFLIDECIA